MLVCFSTSCATIVGSDEAAPTTAVTESAALPLLPQLPVKSKAAVNEASSLRFESRSRYLSCVVGSRPSATPSVLLLISRSARRKDAKRMIPELSIA